MAQEKNQTNSNPGKIQKEDYTNIDPPKRKVVPLKKDKTKAPKPGDKRMY